MQAVIDGITFSGDITEMVEFARAISSRVAVRTLSPCEKTDTIVSAAKQAQTEGRVEVMAKCGHTVIRNSARGRKPELCADCKGSTGVDMAEVKTEVKVKANSGNKRSRRGWDYSADDAWREQPMSDKQEARIRTNLEKREIPAAKRNYWAAQVDRTPRISAGIASDIWREMKVMPRKGEQQR